ncbi:hypothetical protein K449DRAFT_429077 [Hypoxylon sp. EC38]|nr:hypothetical protein K449DRAFT_429077 [Hypoxylon sp. EC38]
MDFTVIPSIWTWWPSIIITLNHPHYQFQLISELSQNYVIAVTNLTQTSISQDSPDTYAGRCLLNAIALYYYYDFIRSLATIETIWTREKTRPTSKNKNVSRRDQDCLQTPTLTASISYIPVQRSHPGWKYLLQACIMQNSSVYVTAKWLFCAATSPLACGMVVSACQLDLLALERGWSSRRSSQHDTNSLYREADIMRTLSSLRRNPVLLRKCPFGTTNSHHNLNAILTGPLSPPLSAFTTATHAKREREARWGGRMGEKRDH